MKNLKLIQMHSKLTEQIFSKKNKLSVYQLQKSNYQDFFLDILKNYNCTFIWQSRSFKKKGHLKYQTKNGILHKEIAIASYSSSPELLYLTFHELTHLINDHPVSKNITTKQKEVVADTVAKMLLSSLGLLDSLSSTSLELDLNLTLYSILWLKKATLTKSKEKIVFEQIENTYQYLSDQLLLSLKK